MVSNSTYYGVRQEIQVLHKLVTDTTPEETYDERISRLGIAIGERSRAVAESKAVLNVSEIKLLLSLYPENNSGKTLLVNSLNEILVSPLAHLNKLIPFLIEDMEFDYYVKLIELNAGKGKTLTEEMEEFSILLDAPSSYHADEIFKKKTLTDFEAKLLLASICFFDKDHDVKPFPYSKLYNLLKTAPRYSSLQNLTLDTYEFGKFYVLRKLAQEMSGEDKLVAMRRKVINTVPPRSVEGWDVKPEMSEISLVDYIRAGADLKKRIEQTQLTPDDIFRMDMEKKQAEAERKPEGATV